MNGLYVLEVQRYVFQDHVKGYFHVGYMDKIFKSKMEAVEYYDNANTHMRSINAHDNYCSDWDPNTYLRYIVRSYHAEATLIRPF